MSRFSRPIALLGVVAFSFWVGLSMERATSAFWRGGSFGESLRWFAIFSASTAGTIGCFSWFLKLTWSRSVN